MQAVFVSVDPERDTPERLREYLSYFNPAFLGMTGTPEELIIASTPFGIFYEQHEGSAATGYLVDHTATITVIDKEGYVRLVFPYGMGAEAMAADLDQFVKCRVALTYHKHEDAKKEGNDQSPSFLCLRVFVVKILVICPRILPMSVQ